MKLADLVLTRTNARRWRVCSWAACTCGEDLAGMLDADETVFSGDMLACIGCGAVYKTRLHAGGSIRLVRHEGTLDGSAILGLKAGLAEARG